MLNKTIVMGRLTADPELRHTANGTAVATFSIACERDRKAENGERPVDFLDVVAWRGTAEFAANYFQKGRMAVVSGSLQTRNWTDKDGNSRKTVEMLPPACPLVRRTTLKRLTPTTAHCRFKAVMFFGKRIFSCVLQLSPKYGTAE